MTGHGDQPGKRDFDLSGAVHLQARQGLGTAAGVGAGRLARHRAEQPRPGLVDRHREHIARADPVARAIRPQPAHLVERGARGMVEHLDHVRRKIDDLYAERVRPFFEPVEHLGVGRTRARQGTAGSECEQGAEQDRSQPARRMRFEFDGAILSALKPMMRGPDRQRAEAAGRARSVARGATGVQHGPREPSRALARGAPISRCHDAASAASNS